MIRCIRCNKPPIVPIWIGEVAYCNSCATQEVKNLKDENERLRELLRRVEPVLEHTMPPSPDHICGTPDAFCDCRCMEYAVTIDLLLAVRNAIKKGGA